MPGSPFKTLKAELKAAYDAGDADAFDDTLVKMAECKGARLAANARRLLLQQPSPVGFVPGEPPWKRNPTPRKPRPRKPKSEPVAAPAPVPEPDKPDPVLDPELELDPPELETEAAAETENAAETEAEPETEAFDIHRPGIRVGPYTTRSLTARSKSAVADRGPGEPYRVRAARMFAEGATWGEVARALGVLRDTLEAWYARGQTEYEAGRRDTRFVFFFRAVFDSVEFRVDQVERQALKLALDPDAKAGGLGLLAKWLQANRPQYRLGTISQRPGGAAAEVPVKDTPAGPAPVHEHTEDEFARVVSDELARARGKRRG